MSDEEKDKEKKGEESAEAKVARIQANAQAYLMGCLLYTSPSPRDQRGSRMPSSA